jgi:hypothetical protein
MKKNLIFMVMLGLLAFGCSDHSEVSGPENTVNQSEPNWISLPSKVDSKGMSIMAKPSFQASEYIDGAKGGKLKVDQKYKGPDGEVKVKAELEFKKGAFEGVKFITMELGTDFGNTTFSPHAVFMEDAIYNTEFEGLDLPELSKEQEKQIKFVYQSPDGSYEYIDVSKIEVDTKKGKLKVKDAKLPHFSRYGFVN